MAGSEMDEGRNDIGLRSGSAGMVLLQRRNSERHVREDDETRDEGRGASPSTERSEQGTSGVMASIDVKGLTAGETLLIARRRSGESQEKWADRHGVTRNFYGRVERDEETCASMPIPELDELTSAEKCLILRRRSGLTQEECAEKIGVTRFWFNQMEIGKVETPVLVEFWESKV